MATHPHESTPLIPSSLPGEIRIGAVDSGKGNKVWAEVWIVVKTSIPVALTYMLQNSLQTACVLIVGRSMVGVCDICFFLFFLSLSFFCSPSWRFRVWEICTHPINFSYIRAQMNLLLPPSPSCLRW